MNKYENEIEEALSSYENYKPYHLKSIEWICNRIDWCWKWRHIRKEKMEEFANRIIKIMETYNK